MSSRAVLFLAIVAAGCSTAAGRPEPVEPLPALDGLDPVHSAVPGTVSVPDSAVRDWTAEYRPDTVLRYTVRWRYQTPKGDASGRAEVTVSLPDSITFRYSAPLGKRGWASFVGLRAVAAEPPEDGERFMAFAPVAWGALGLPWAPPEGHGIVGPVRGDRRTWRLVLGDTVVTYVRWDPARPDFTTQVVVGERVIGTARAVFDPHGDVIQRGHMRLDGPGTFMALEFSPSR